ncbi:MAG TPA: DUF2795 domain-containing protein [Solirubrobacteraceae bacterium]|nr:DUF2795 domain-containing protein [Solirubrobacteraceae bacterium]
MDETPLEAVEKYVEGLQWPASKDEVVEAVRRNGAPDDVVQKLLADDRDRFTGPNEVHQVLWKEA